MSYQENSGQGDKKQNLGEDRTMVEIERKFLVSDDTSQKIANRGGKFKGETSFSDSYFDTESYILTQKDYWLRRRNEQWELKMPPSIRNSESVCTQYEEVTSEKDIASAVAAILNDAIATDSAVDQEPNGNNEVSSEDKVEHLVQRQGLKPFAVFSTQRKNYVIDGGVLVTIDEADFGFSVGEIEMMVQINDADEMNNAIRKIESLAKDLGFLDVVSRGKLEAYLATRNPHHYRALVRCGIFKEDR